MVVPGGAPGGCGVRRAEQASSRPGGTESGVGVCMKEQGLLKYLSELVGERTVAVVGNAPRLTSEGFGPTIDAHDVVIRFNDARIDGLERCAGARTTLRMVGFSMADRHMEFFRTLDEGSTILSKIVNRARLKEAGKTDALYYGFGIGRQSLGILAELTGEPEVARETGVPRSGLVLIAYLLRCAPKPSLISLFGMEREVRRDGDEHFYADGRRFETVLRSYHLHQMPIEREIALFNSVIDRNPGLIAFH